MLQLFVDASADLNTFLVGWYWYGNNFVDFLYAMYLLICVQASSVNMFKNKIDKYLVKAGYT